MDSDKTDKTTDTDPKDALNAAAHGSPVNNEGYDPRRPQKATIQAANNYSEEEIEKIVEHADEARAEQSLHQEEPASSKGKIENDFGSAAEPYTVFIQGERHKKNAAILIDNDDEESNEQENGRKKRERAAIEATHDQMNKDKTGHAAIEAGKPSSGDDQSLGDTSLPRYRRGIRESFIVRDYYPLDLMCISMPNPKKMTEEDKVHLKKYLKKAILHGALNKGWDTFYFENTKGQIDPVMTAFAQEALSDLQQDLAFRKERKNLGKLFSITEKEERVLNHLENITISNTPKKGIQLNQIINPYAYIEQLNQLWKTQISEPTSRFIDDHGLNAGRSIKRKVWGLTD